MFLKLIANNRQKLYNHWWVYDTINKLMAHKILRNHILILIMIIIIIIISDNLLPKLIDKKIGVFSLFSYNSIDFQYNNFYIAFKTFFPIFSVQMVFSCDDIVVDHQISQLSDALKGLVFLLICRFLWLFLFFSCYGVVSVGRVRQVLATYHSIWGRVMS